MGIDYAYALIIHLGDERVYGRYDKTKILYLYTQDQKWPGLDHINWKHTSNR